VFQELILFFDLDKFRRRQRRVPAILYRAYPEHHHPFRLRIWQRTQQNGVYDAEDRRVRADAEGERESGGGRECSGFLGQPQGVTAVLEKFILPLLWCLYYGLP